MKSKTKKTIFLCFVFACVSAFLTYHFYENRCFPKLVFLKYSYLEGSSPFPLYKYYYQLQVHGKKEILSVNIHSYNDSIQPSDFELTYLLKETSILEITHSIRKAPTQKIYFDFWEYQFDIESFNNAKLYLDESIILDLVLYKEDTCITVDDQLLCNVSIYRHYLEESSYNWYTDYYVHKSSQLLLKVNSKQLGDMDYFLNLIQVDTIQNSNDGLEKQLKDLFNYFRKSNLVD